MKTADTPPIRRLREPDAISQPIPANLLRRIVIKVDTERLTYYITHSFNLIIARLAKERLSLGKMWGEYCPTGLNNVLENKNK